MTLGDVHVGELRFRVDGLDDDTARALARLVAGQLGALATGAAISVDVDRMAVEVEARPGDDPAILAGRIVDRMRGSLDRLAEGGGPAS